jgi:hypothetical protein
MRPAGVPEIVVAPLLENPLPVQFSALRSDERVVQFSSETRKSRAHLVMRNESHRLSKKKRGTGRFFLDKENQF